MIIKLQRRHRDAIRHNGRVVTAELTEFTGIRGKIGGTQYCCQVFEKAYSEIIIEWEYRIGRFTLVGFDGHPLDYCPFCGEEITYLVMKNIEVVRVQETKTRTVPNMVQQGTKEEQYIEEHWVEKEVP